MNVVYIIESETISKWYIGYSTNLDARLEDHNSNRSKWTRFKGQGPWQLIFKREFDTKSEALKFEKQLKKIKNKRYICDRFREYFIE